MAITTVGPCQQSPGLPGGLNAAYNITGAGTVVKAGTAFLSRIAVVAAGSSGSLTLNDASGYVTTQTITGITAAAAAVVTISTGGASNPFAVGNTVTFASVGGMTQINPLVGLVTAIGGVTTAWTITTNINSSAFTAWSSGGTIASFGATNQIVSIAQANLTLPITLDWPCAFGILVSAVPAGSPQISLSYT